MATIDKLYKSMGLPMNIKRGNPWPLDASSLWYSYDEMKTYAEDTAGVSYVGQILALVDEEKNTATAYIIADANGTLKQVGAGPLVDNKTIIVNEETDEIGLKDFGKRFYKYIPEEKDLETGLVLKEAEYKLVEVSEQLPWTAGLEPRVVSEDGKLVLGWFEPNPTTIEGVNNQVSSIQSSVADLQQVVEGLVGEVGKPAEGSIAATGLYAELDKKVNAKDVYNKTEVDTLIDIAVSSADHLQRKIVTSYADITTFITENGADKAAKYIFMVPEADTTADGNIYEEYIVINGVIEVVGKWATDLSGYVTDQELEDVLVDYAKTSDIDTKLEGYATTGQLGLISADITSLETQLANKVEKEEGKRLITEEEAEKLKNLSSAGEENFVKSVTSDFTVLNGELSLNKDNLDLSNNENIKAISGRVTSVETTVGTLSSNLQALQETINANASAIEAINQSQATMQEAVDKNKTDIEGLITKTNGLENSLNSLNDLVTLNKNNITSLETQLNNYVLKTDYDKDIAEIRDILTWKTMEEPTA